MQNGMTDPAERRSEPEQVSSGSQNHEICVLRGLDEDSRDAGPRLDVVGDCEMRIDLPYPHGHRRYLVHLLLGDLTEAVEHGGDRADLSQYVADAQQPE